MDDEKKDEKRSFEVIEIYGIYDNKGEKFDVPFFAQSDLFAKRRFIMLVKDGGILKEFLNDFSLVNLGSFNIVSGKIKPVNKTILEGKQIRKEKDENEINNET